MDSLVLPERGDVLSAKESPFVAQVLVERFGGERDEGGKKDFQGVNGPQGDINGRPSRCPVFFDLKPGALFLQVLVDLPRQGHGLAQGGAELAPRQHPTDGAEGHVYAGQ